MVCVPWLNLPSFTLLFAGANPLTNLIKTCHISKLFFSSLLIKIEMFFRVEFACSCQVFPHRFNWDQTKLSCCTLTFHCRSRSVSFTAFNLFRVNYAGLGISLGRIIILLFFSLSSINIRLHKPQHCNEPENSSVFNTNTNVFPAQVCSKG